MGARPSLEKTAGKPRQPREREEPEAPTLNLGCGTLLVLFLLIATAGKFLPHGEKPLSTPDKPPPMRTGDGKPTGQPTARPDPAVVGVAKTTPPESKPAKPKRVAREADSKPSHGVDGWLARLGQWGDAAQASLASLSGRWLAPASQRDSSAPVVAKPVLNPLQLTKPPAPVVAGPKVNAPSPPPTAAPVPSGKSASTGADPTASNRREVRLGDAIQGKPVVFNSPWNQSVAQVERYLKRHTHNADSVEILEWGKVAAIGRGYEVRCTFRSKNVLGKVATQTKLFVLDSRGEVTEIRD